MGFSGIPAEAFDFYDALAADNTKIFWGEHKSEYEAHIRGPLRELAAELEPRFGPAHIYRPYRDVRFSKDKTPYKDQQGMFVELRNGLGWYLQISASGLMVAGGWYQATPDQIKRYRAAVAGREGEQLAALVRGLRRSRLEVGGDQMKTRPRGIDEAHPQVELLRYRTLYASHTWQPAAWMGSRRALGRIGQQWEKTRPFVSWLADVVGPGDAPVGSRRPAGGA